jgi:hypothetical protein
VTEIDPPNLYIDPTSTSNTPVYVHGNNYLPILGKLKCLLKAPSGNLIVDATYINNHTLECDIPPPTSSWTLPYSMVIEVSSDGGDTYSSNNVAFIYRALDSLSGGSISPLVGYVDGNTFITIKYSYCFDPSALTSSCKFTDLNSPYNSITT